MQNELVNNILELISKLNLLELSDLIIKIEKKFNLVAEEEKREIIKEKFDIYLSEIGDKKINLIKAIKDITNLSLKESKDLVEKKNALIKKNVNKNECEDISKKINSVGGKVEIK
ncbi:ribosomal protein bL12 [Candidatus Carsonella ruddii]|uniref:Large ribosomal subunit protein bL12 n=1 Tax=Candidatus Carsonella ruddii (Diaphorina cf. continua) TaxID=2661587 RepID=A0A7R6VYG6_CARRU|nr:bL12 family ribosomal protein [Candidatus Carsonella ruddii (Diaphorina cf. continua)]BCG49402.1 50S ribosomal protein L7/L12 [Candidatus Carsonella ruddii (Diaphorina cf. continua)]